MSRERRGERLVVAVGARVRFRGARWQVVALSGQCFHLVGESGDDEVVLAGYLFADPDFAVLGVEVGQPQGVPRWGLFETAPAAARERALAWQRHIREVECGRVGGPDGGGAVRPEYDPARWTLAERERAKAEELTALGFGRVSRTTVQRMRGRYRRQGLWGLVDHRTTRGPGGVGRTDERVVAAIRDVLRGQRGRSKGTVKGLMPLVARLLEERHGDAVVVPSSATFYRLVGRLAHPVDHPGRPVRNPPITEDGRGLTPTVALRPGEQVQIDTTRLDVLALFEDGTVGRPELTIAVDVATRAILAAVLCPGGTRAVDAALLLAEMAVPHPARPTWPDALRFAHARLLSRDRLMTLDERLEGAAARPVVVPETIVVDRGKVFLSGAFTAACETLGISVQPAPPYAPTAKGIVERTFGSINTLFCRHLPGYTGSDAGRRGRNVEREACFGVAQLQDLLDEWLVHWHQRPHEGLRHPVMPRVALTPNRMWAALVAVAGYVPVPLSGGDYLELLPVRWQAVTERGIRLHHRTYDHEVLGPYRGQASPIAARDGKWEVHHNPHDGRQVWVRLPGGEFAEVPWIHRDHVNAPFDVHAWRHVRENVERRGDRERHEADLADVLAALLREVRPAAGPARGGSRRSRGREDTAAGRAVPGARRVVEQAGTGHDGHAANSEGVAGFVFPGRVPGAAAHDGAGVGVESLDDLDGGGEFLDEDAPCESESESGGVSGGGGGGGFGLYDAHAEAESW